MSLECLNNVVLNNLSINIDISNINSWNLNSDLNVISLNKWSNAIVDDLLLNDYGLTAYDNAFVNRLDGILNISQDDDRVTLNRIGFNVSTGNTTYSAHTITTITGSSIGNYFSLSGGYLQGFFKLAEYDYQLFPPRYNNGITIETLIEVLPESHGIFYLMGTRAEDKYNPFYSGETNIVSESNILYGGKFTGKTYTFEGIVTTENNYLNSYQNTTETLTSFNRPENAKTEISSSVEQYNNVSNNVISFEITNSKRLKYKYVNEFGSLVENESSKILRHTGWTLIDIVFKPYEIIQNYDETKYLCYGRRLGDLIFYVDGRSFWKIKDFNEFYFKKLDNDKEKQLGVPFNISWGGGSFGLKHSWHYSDYNKTDIIQDNNKQNLLIEQYFNSSYIGSIQKLRVYDNALNGSEILHNAIFESGLNGDIIVSKGGRLIYR